MFLGRTDVRFLGEPQLFILWNAYKFFGILDEALKRTALQFSQIVSVLPENLNKCSIGRTAPKSVTYSCGGPVEQQNE